MSYVPLGLFRQPVLPVAMPADARGYRLRVAFRARRRDAIPRTQ